VCTQPKGGYQKPELLTGQTVYLENERGFFREFSAETQQRYAQNLERDFSNLLMIHKENTKEI